MTLAKKKKLWGKKRKKCRRRKRNDWVRKMKWDKRKPGKCHD